MLASDLDFFLPEELIAQTAVEPRDAARLMVLRSFEQSLEHRVISDLPGLLRPNDLLVFNDTRVLQARLFGTRETGGKVEALLLKEKRPNEWECLLKPSARIRVGQPLHFAGGGISVRAETVERGSDSWLLRFLPEDGGDVRDLLGALGEVPLPPYIRSKSDPERYQTVYSRSRAGEENPLDSAAAPTAGLHFTPGLLDRLREMGIETAFLTLAVGAGTFRPVQTETVDEHQMHVEEFSVPDATAAAIARQRQRGARVVAVGTTVTRALESVADASGCVQPGFGETRIFIRPGYNFKCVDALITNFHLPRSTLLVLVAAFVEYRMRATHAGELRLSGENLGGYQGLPVVQTAYAEAVNQGYRFFSFGDAMLIE
jgi:S-adenosylmethionine:tRNA ribosyltransferase-isomerase